MKLFRLKYWESEHIPQLCSINTSAITVVHTYNRDNVYFLEINFDDKSFHYDYAAELNRDNDMRLLMDEISHDDEIWEKNVTTTLSKIMYQIHLSNRTQSALVDRINKAKECNTEEHSNTNNTLLQVYDRILERMP